MADYTKKQLDVIDASVDNILVSAAAGSGKTTVLVERIIRKIRSGSLSIDNVLVVTFTKAAANNMLEKIEKALKKEIKENPENSGELKKQLDLLPNAYIQTLNAFCSRVVKEKGYELVLKDSFAEPNMAILGEQELKIMLRKAAQEAIDAKYLSMALNGEDISFNKAINYFTNGRNDSDLVERLIEVYPKLRSLPEYISKIENAYQMRLDNDSNGRVGFLGEYNKKFIELFKAANISAKKSSLLVDQTLFVAKKNEERQAIATNTLKVIMDETSKVISLSDADVSQEELFESIKQAITAIKNTEEIGLGGKDESVNEFANDFGAVAALCINSYGRNPRGYKNIASPYVVDSEYVAFLDSSVEDLLSAQKERTEVIGVFVDLLKQVDANYSNLKRRYHAMDFSDQEHFALMALSEQEVCEYYKDKFAEIYVDEYQDNSTLQDAIIQKISKHNVFMVGDVKQSIYKFRYANPNMFIEKMDDYKKPDGNGTLYDLNNNFRSTPEILEFTNVIFNQLMSRATEIEYDESHWLNPSPTAQKGNSLPRVVLVNNVACDEANDSEATDDSGITKIVKVEFAGILKEVERYLKDYEPKDICILTRKKKASREISQMLCSRGILAVCPESKTIYGDPDISTLCALLTLLGNEHRDECLIGVLLAGYRFSNFTVDEIAKISVFAKRSDLLYMNLIVKIRMYAMQEEVPEEDKDLLLRVKRFVDVFDDLRSDAVILNIGELIEKIYSVSGIKATLSKNSDADKLVVFKNWLCENYLSQGSDIASISGSLEELKLQLGDKANIEYESSEANAITCMTYHKSKGLEFKCVIVTDLNSKENESNSSSVIFDENKGFLCNDYFDDELIRDKSFERLMYEDDEKLSEYSEIIRLFYVALTRAEKNLSVVTSYSISSKPKEKYEPIYRKIVSQGNEKLDRNYILKQSNKNGIFLSALLRLSGAQELFCMVEENADIKVPADLNMRRINFNGFELDMFDYSDELVARDGEKVDVEAVYEECLAHIDADGNPYFDSYAYEKSITAPSKTTVSELKKEEQKLLYDAEKKSEEETAIDTKVAVNLIVPELDYFRDENTYDTSSSKGTLIHNLLRFMDFKLMNTKLAMGQSASDVLDEEIGFLKDSGVVTLAMIPVISEFKNSLTKFIESELFSRISAAENNNKAEFEKPIMFTTKVDDNGDYTIVQGVLDVLMYEDGEAVIVDYKTDRIDTNDVEEISKIVNERHKLQLDLYASALKANGIKVKEKIIWLIRKGIAVTL